MSNEWIVADGYLVVEGVENQYGVMNSAKFVKVTARLPQMDGSQRAVRVQMKLPKACFEPIAIVNVVVPEGDVVAPVVEIG